jgi:hypothetical protein
MNCGKNSVQILHPRANNKETRKPTNKSQDFMIPERLINCKVFCFYWLSASYVAPHPRKMSRSDSTMYSIACPVTRERKRARDGY